MLATKDRLVQWGLLNDGACVKCSGGNEPVSHLFFKCQYSKAIWKSCMQLLGIHRQVMGFDDEVKAAAQINRGKRDKHKLYNMLFLESNYHIWLQRNLKAFNNTLLAWQDVKLIVFSYLL